MLQSASSAPDANCPSTLENCEPATHRFQGSKSENARPKSPRPNLSPLSPRLTRPPEGRLVVSLRTSTRARHRKRQIPRLYSVSMAESPESHSARLRCRSTIRPKRPDQGKPRPRL